MNIKTSQWALCPIPCFEWSAWDDETYDGEGCPVGSGKTEQDAIDDLMWKLEEQKDNEP
jgi:hypothetical protein